MCAYTEGRYREETITIIVIIFFSISRIGYYLVYTPLQPTGSVACLLASRHRSHAYNRIQIYDFKMHFPRLHTLTICTK